MFSRLVIDTTPIHLAVECKFFLQFLSHPQVQDYEVLALLLQHTSYKGTQNDYYGRTPLDYAVTGFVIKLIPTKFFSDPSILSLLLSKMTTESKRNLRVPLRTAVEMGKTENAMMLLELFKLPELSVANLSFNILDEVIVHGSVEMVEHLIKKKVHTHPDMHPLHAAARSTKPENLQFLIQTGLFDINARDSFGQTPLVEACKRNSKAVDILLDHPDVDVNILSPGNIGPLQLLLSNGRIKLAIRILEKSDHHINSRTAKNKQTPLQAFLDSEFDKSQKLEQVKLLIQYGAKPDKDEAILYVTAKQELVDVLEYFLRDMRFSALQGLQNGTTALAGAAEAKLTKHELHKLLSLIFIFGGVLYTIVWRLY